MENRELIALRKLRYFTQEGLAKELNVSRYYVWRMENHGTVPSHKIREKLAIVLKVSDNRINKIFKIK